MYAILYGKITLLHTRKNFVYKHEPDILFSTWLKKTKVQIKYFHHVFFSLTRFRAKSTFEMFCLTRNGKKKRFATEQRSIELGERNEEKEWHCLWMCIPKYNLLHIAYAFYDYCSWSKFVVCISRHDLVPMTIKLHKRLWWKLGECEEGEYVRCCFCLILFLYTLHTTLSNDSEVCQNVLNLLPL